MIPEGLAGKLSAALSTDDSEELKSSISAGRSISSSDELVQVLLSDEAEAEGSQLTRVNSTSGEVEWASFS